MYTQDINTKQNLEVLNKIKEEVERISRSAVYTFDLFEPHIVQRIIIDCIIIPEKEVD